MIRVITVVCSCILFLSILLSCRTHDLELSDSVMSNVYAERVYRDSIFLYDSVLVRERADTVFLIRTRTLYREHMRIDTLWRIDTVVHVKNVYTEKRASGKSGLWWVFILVPVVFLLIRRFRNCL